MAAPFAHPLLGSLVPKSGDGVNTFRGLKYASLKNRFASPELFTTENGAIDATSYGPSVVTTPIGCDLEFGLIQQSLPKSEFSSSELEGLNLNITVPKNIANGQKLPVFVFIHGGGFGIGGNSWPQYDFGKLVQLSVEVGTPIIGVNINYRLGIFGFLTSEELRNAGYSANNGLKDQRVAFEWIKKYISGFGGDPENITVGGESAGGVSTTLHLHSEQHQFTRAISFSGTGLLMKPIPYFVHEMTYQTVLQHLGITATTAEERVQALLKVPVAEILSKLPPGLPLHPAIDGDVIPVPAGFADVEDAESPALPGKKWCKSLLIGDCQFDASVFLMALEPREGDLATNFISSMTKNLAAHPGIADAIFASYGITKNMPREDAILAILNFATDIGFVAPTQAYARGWPGKAYVYCFNEPNPWEGRFKGYTTHVLDVAFLFQNYNHTLDAAQAQSAKNFAVDVINFVNDIDPWDVFPNGGRVRVYGPSVGANEAVLLEVSGKGDDRINRRATIFQFVKEPGLDTISMAFTMYLGGH